MFSVIFPGQGSQIVGMGKELHAKFDTVKKLFNEADKILEFSMSSLILEGPKDQLDLTENTQPAIFLVSYSIFQLAREEFSIDLNKAKFFAGHSLGEYTALASAESMSFSETLKILKIRGNAMQSAVSKGELLPTLPAQGQIPGQPPPYSSQWHPDPERRDPGAGPVARQREP